MVVFVLWLVGLCGIVANWVCDVSTETFSRTEGTQACVQVCLGVCVFVSSIKHFAELV